jgi:hypothetical protein
MKDDLVREELWLDMDMAQCREDERFVKEDDIKINLSIYGTQ